MWCWLTRLVGLILAVTQLAAANALTLLGMGESIAARSAVVDQPSVPAPLAFVIWGLIYPACLAYAVFQTLPRQHNEALLTRVRGSMTLAFLANTVWPIYVQLAGFRPLSFALIVAILVPLLIALDRVERATGRLSIPEQVLVRWPIGIFAGWLTAATFVNLAASIKDAGGLHLGGWVVSESAVAGAVIVAAALLATTVVVRLGGCLPYTLSVAWGLGWIVARNLAAPPDRSVASVAAAMTLLLGVGSAWAGLNSARRHAASR